MKRIFVGIIYCLLSLHMLPVFAFEDDDLQSRISSQNHTDLPKVVYLGTNEFPPVNIEAFEDSQYEIAVFNLDAQRNLEESLTRDLPQNVEQAEQIVRDRTKQLSQDDILSIFQAPAIVIKWGIQKTPAWIFNNGTSVIYGVTDARYALQLWEDWKKEQ